MTDPRDPNIDALTGEGVPTEEGPLEVEQLPRRAASAQFVVDAEVGSEAALREAMDPANQSLTDALRLSYRILRFVMVVLLALFLVSGFETVTESQTGVRLLFGKMQVNEMGDAALGTGLRWSIAPYPAGEFIIFNQSDTVSIDRVFFPQLRSGETVADAISRTQPHDPLQPGLDGALLTADDGIVHLQLRATYIIDDPVGYLSNMRQDKAKEIITLALQRGSIHTVAEMTVDEFLDNHDELAGRIRDAAQQVLNGLNAGVTLDRVQTMQVRPPFAIVKVFDELQNAVNDAGSRRSEGLQDRERVLIGTAGANFRHLVELIESYEDAVEAWTIDPETESQVESARTAIAEFLESERAGGDIGRIVNAARSYRTQIESRLNSDVERFHGLLPTYRATPSLVVQKLIADSYRTILSADGVEQFILPGNSRSYMLRVASLQDVMLIRRRLRQQTGQQAAWSEYDRPFMQSFTDQPRQLWITEDGQVRGRTDRDPVLNR